MADYNGKYKGSEIDDAIAKAKTAIQPENLEGYTKTITFTNATASTWVEDATYADYGYRCDIACTGVTADSFAEVVFDVAEATSGAYAPICETKANAVSIWSSSTDGITIPVIIITQ